MAPKAARARVGPQNRFVSAGDHGNLFDTEICRGHVLQISSMDILRATSPDVVAAAQVRLRPETVFCFDLPFEVAQGHANERETQISVRRGLCNCPRRMTC